MHAIVPEVWGLEWFETTNAKVTLKVTQGHCRCSHSIDNIWLPISPPL